MSDGTLSALLQYGVTVLFLGTFAWIVLRHFRKELASQPLLPYAPEMVAPHARIVEAAKAHPEDVWLEAPGGHILCIKRQKVKGGRVLYFIERLDPESLTLVPGERGLLETFICLEAVPPVLRRLRAVYGGEHGRIYTVDENPVSVEDMIAVLPAMIVDADDLQTLAGQLEEAIQG